MILSCLYNTTWERPKMDSEAFEAAEEPPVCCGGIESVLKKNRPAIFLRHLRSFYWATIRMVLSQDVGLFPIVYRRKKLGNNSQGIRARTSWEWSPDSAGTSPSAQATYLLTYFSYCFSIISSGLVEENATIEFGQRSQRVRQRRPREWFPWSTGRVFPPIDHGKRSHNMREHHRDWVLSL